MAPAQTIEAKDLPPELMNAQPGAAPGAALPAATTTEALPMPGAVAAVTPMATPATAAAAPAVAVSTASGPPQWLAGLEQEGRRMLLAGEPEVWDALTRKFEAQLIHTALEITRGRRIEAAQKLGIGRNTITRKIQELGLDD